MGSNFAFQGGVEGVQGCYHDTFLPCLLKHKFSSVSATNLVAIITSFYPEEVWVAVENEAKPPSNVYMLRTTKI